MDNINSQKTNSETKADKFWSIFLPVKDGKIKSTLLVNSFSLSFLFLAVYILSYLLLIDPIDAMIAEHMSPLMVSLIESIIPAIIGSLLCCSLHFLVSDKRIVPAAYIWLVIYSLFVFIGMLTPLQAEERSLFFQLFGLLIVVPVITGGIFSTFLYFRYQKKITF